MSDTTTNFNRRAVMEHGLHVIAHERLCDTVELLHYQIADAADLAYNTGQIAEHDLLQDALSGLAVVRELLERAKAARVTEVPEVPSTKVFGHDSTSGVQG